MDSKLFSGTLEMLILEVISAGPTYGYEIAQQVVQRSGERFESKEGSLYPALHRMQRQKMLAHEWREADGRRRKYYKLTAVGKKALVKKKTEWLEFTRGIEGVLGGITYGMA
ncbi:PadR family transcriptional regulator [bacterium]|nr:PadR family transcriptional regulator [bacterium]